MVWSLQALYNHIGVALLPRNRGNRRQLGDLPDDILMEIFSRLAERDVLRCRMVCQRWKVLTSKPCFTGPKVIVRKRRGRAEIELFLIDKLGTRSEQKIEVHRIPISSIDSEDKDKYFLHFSCNGLLVLKQVEVFKLIAREERPLTTSIILNPITREEIRIVTPGGDICGVFFHTFIKEYCVLWGLFSLECAQLKMLNLGSEPCWRDLELATGSSLGSHRPRSSCAPVVLNDVLFWMIQSCESQGSFELASCAESIMAFDIKTEKFIPMPHPGPTDECNPSKHKEMHILEMNGLLSLVECSNRSAARSITVKTWILKDFASKLWMQNHNLDIAVNFPLWSLKPFAFLNGELLLMRQWASYGCLYACNLKLCTSREINVKFRFPHCCEFWMFAHVPSLVSLKNCNSEIWMESPPSVSREGEFQTSGSSAAVLEGLL